MLSQLSWLVGSDQHAGCITTARDGSNITCTAACPHAMRAGMEAIFAPARWPAGRRASHAAHEAQDIFGSKFDIFACRHKGKLLESYHGQAGGRSGLWSSHHSCWSCTTCAHSRDMSCCLNDAVRESPSQFVCYERKLSLQSTVSYSCLKVA